MWPRALGSCEREREREREKQGEREIMKKKELYKVVVSVQCLRTCVMIVMGSMH